MKDFEKHRNRLKTKKDYKNSVVFKSEVNVGDRRTQFAVR